ncbi:unnamed protein product [Arabidopsis arenosa]|uniref:Metalloenzyme domain-containing protein n=1 Tax=Arabidopsis arenosa TaxID=38785 RepID=A0A8S1ZCS4_ARAAE|nr:unnamed protein product [Arabidopsis arenosa]CAE5957001.1 unnamed protein product [Arabidopsis arenosa]CAE5957006.1 unnamed protein product [Arabidopsis arenosa]CAE5957008.1 unnamed protein product [Arabidopsis arenosa]
MRFAGSDVVSSQPDDNSQTHATDFLKGSHRDKNSSYVYSDSTSRGDQAKTSNCWSQTSFSAPNPPGNFNGAVTFCSTLQEAFHKFIGQSVKIFCSSRTLTTVVACEAADLAVKMILDAIEQVKGIYAVTADHGNALDMVKRDKSEKPALDKEGKLQILTSHTLEPVPIAIGGPGLTQGVRFRKDLEIQGLANVAATVMNLHGFVAPSDYEPTLIEVVE